jgi:hypothetical protein
LAGGFAEGREASQWREAAVRPAAARAAAGFDRLPAASVRPRVYLFAHP